MIKKLILLVVLALSIYGCKPIEKIIYVDKPIIKIQIDSVYTHSTDSFIEKQKGDTILQYRFKTLYKESLKLRVDTITKIKQVDVPYSVDKIVPQKGFIYYSGLFL